PAFAFEPGRLDGFLDFLEGLLALRRDAADVDPGVAARLQLDGLAIEPAAAFERGGEDARGFGVLERRLAIWRQTLAVGRFDLEERHLQFLGDFLEAAAARAGIVHAVMNILQLTGHL